MKPSVNNQCILDKNNIPTVAITSPNNVNTKALSQDVTEITWDQSQQSSESPIVRYRIFIQEKDSVGSSYYFETSDNQLTFSLKTPKAMWGKDYLLSIQAISANNKQSLISDPAVFKVNLPSYMKKKGSTGSKDQVNNVKVLLANPNKIVLAWLDNPDAQYYKLRWDKGDPKTKPFVDLVDTPSSEIYITSKNAPGIMGSPALSQNGGTFNFEVYFIDKKWGKLSKPSNILTVNVKPI